MTAVTALSGLVFLAVGVQGAVAAVRDLRRGEDQVGALIISMVVHVLVAVAGAAVMGRSLLL